jgi:malonate transporter and related proteins
MDGWLNTVRPLRLYIASAQPYRAVSPHAGPVMLPVFESILPIFLLVIVGIVLRRLPMMNDDGWTGIEQLAYWFLYPVLIFVTILNADFSGLTLDSMLAALILSISLMAALLLGLWPALRARNLVSVSQFSSVFQTALRWNGFMALAIAHNLFPPEGAAVVALAMAAIILPINVICVLVITRFADASASWRKLAMQLASNPLILATAGAITLRWAGGIYEPLNDSLRIVGSAAIGVGLIAIGAGLRLGDLASTRFAMWLPIVLKLAVFPAIVVSLALVLGLSAQEIQYLALCAAVPTAMNGYLLARKLGGDAELYAAVTTTQTALAFFTIPAVLALAAQLSG